MTARNFVIISGGQTGVDRGALDAALESGAPCGGWCPEGRLAEDGVIAARYPLKELPGAGYTKRTRKNVEDSDATLVIMFGETTGGTAKTVEFCCKLGKPYLIVDAATTPIANSVSDAMDFIHARAVRRLNVAGPRASGDVRGYAYARETIMRILTEIGRTE